MQRRERRIVNKHCARTLFGGDEGTEVVGICRREGGHCNLFRAYLLEVSFLVFNMMNR